MGYTTLENQILHSRRGVKQNRGTDLEVIAQGMLDRLEKRYADEGFDISQLGNKQLMEAWRQIIDEEVKYVRVYSPTLDDEIVLSQYGQENWPGKKKIYSRDEMKLLIGADKELLRAVHLLKSEIPGMEVVGVEDI